MQKRKNYTEKEEPEEINEFKSAIQLGDLVISSNEPLQKIEKRIKSLLKNKTIRHYLTVDLPTKKFSTMFD